jgi:hypothetical protein
MSDDERGKMRAAVAGRGEGRGFGVSAQQIHTGPRTPRLMTGVKQPTK